MGYDFDTDRNYNFENSVSMIIELGKTCFSPGEILNGGIILKPKESSLLKYLETPIATLYLTEHAYYTYSESEYNPRTGRNEYVSKVAEEYYPTIPIFSLDLIFKLIFFNIKGVNGRYLVEKFINSILPFDGHLLSSIIISSFFLLLLSFFE